MVVLELKWLVIFAGFSTLIFGLLLLTLQKSSAYIKGPRLWAGACFLMGSGLVVFSSVPISNEKIVLVISPVLFMANRSLYLAGIWQFKGKKSSKTLLYSLPVFALIQSLFFSLCIELPHVRIAINSAIYGVMTFLLCYEMLTISDKSLKKISIINAIVFLFMGCLMLLRVIVSFNTDHPDLLRKSPYSVAFFTTALVLQAILTYGLIIMVNIRVAEDLKKQIGIKDLFFSIIAHDLRNQINIIIGFSDLLQKNIEKNVNDRNEQFAGYIRQASLQTNALLINLLDWAKIQNKIELFNPVKVHLETLIKEEIEALGSISANKQIVIEYDKNNAPANVLADTNMLRTILRNLLINAIKFTNQGGKVSIRTKAVPQFVEINVSDSGIGIDPDVVKKLFNPEILISTSGTLNEKGTGLGLILCKEFVEKHQGNIWIESEFEVGSSVIFTIPALPE